MTGGIDIDLRAKKFAIRIIKMSSVLPRNQAGYVLSKQVIRSGTSIGANIVEAQSSSTKKEFIYKLNISLNEARETLYWLDLIIESGLIKKRD